jgi:parallel beta-helix repeat protein
MEPQINTDKHGNLFSPKNLLSLSAFICGSFFFLCGCIKGPDFPYVLSPRVIVQTPTNPSSANIAVTFQLIDREKEPGNIILEYSTNGGGTFNSATLVDLSETQNLESDWYPGITHTVRWDSVTDMVGRWGDSSVIVKVTPSDVSNPSGGTPGVSAAFVVNNIAYMSIIYVDGTNGSDTNDGLSWATAKKTIQAGINAAANDWGVLVADGTYTGTGNKDLDFEGKAIYLKSVGGAENCIIDCENSGRGFYFHSGETAFAVIEGFTIRNGNAANLCGSGVFCDSSSPTIANCTIANNTAINRGGGVYCYYSSPIISNCTIKENTATNQWGGGISCYTSSNPTIANCRIAGNTARWGGGIDCYLSSSPTIANCTIANNTATYRGGGIESDNSNPMLNNTILWGNSAASLGNQIYTYNSSANVTLNYCDYANGANDVAGAGTVTPNNCINLDPLFVDAANEDYHLQSGSPCIDAGDNSLVPAEITVDLDGNPRIVNGDNDGTATIDLGAYEYQP